MTDFPDLMMKLEGMKIPPDEGLIRMTDNNPFYRDNDRIIEDFHKKVEEEERTQAEFDKIPGWND